MNLNIYIGHLGPYMRNYEFNCCQEGLEQVKLVF